MIYKKILLLCLVSPLTLLETSEFGAAADSIAKNEPTGMAVNIHDTNGCQTLIDIDQQKFSDQLPSFIEAGLFNKRLDPDASQVAFHYLVNTFAVELFKQIIPKVMGAVKANTCSFFYSYITTDQYGNDDRKQMFSFDFDRTTYNKINWDRFDSNNVRIVSRNFSVSPEFNELVKQETVAAFLMLKN